MTYVMSDLHGCWREYQEVLEKIAFTDADRLYILGDIIDRGPAVLELLEDVIARKNVRVLAGNHEHMALQVLARSWKKGIPLSIECMTTETLDNYFFWAEQGGYRTLSQLERGGDQALRRTICFLAELPLYEEVSVGGRDYLLVHAGLEPFRLERSLDDYGPEELLFHRADYSRPYFPDRYTVTGHTPTSSGYILRQNNHIAIDCGCVYGRRLGAFCLETEEEFYVESREGW